MGMYLALRLDLNRQHQSELIRACRALFYVKDDGLLRGISRSWQWLLRVSWSPDK